MTRTALTWPVARAMIRASLPLLKKHLGGPYLPHGGLLTGNLNCPLKPDICKKRRPRQYPQENPAISPLGLPVLHCFSPNGLPSATKLQKLLSWKNFLDTPSNSPLWSTSIFSSIWQYADLLVTPKLSPPPSSWSTFLAFVPCPEFLFLPTKCGYSSEGCYK